jgi:hypothetical protein
MSQDGEAEMKTARGSGLLKRIGSEARRVSKAAKCITEDTKIKPRAYQAFARSLERRGAALRRLADHLTAPFRKH